MFFCSHSAENSTQRKIHLASAGQAGIHTLGSCWNPGIRPSAGVGQQPAWVPCAWGTAAPLAGRLTQENRFWRCSLTPGPPLFMCAGHELRSIHNWVKTFIQWMVRWWMLVYCGCLGSPAELGGSWEFKSQLDPPPQPLGPSPHALSALWLQ